MIYTRLMVKLVSVITNHKVMINQLFECIVLNWQDYIYHWKIYRNKIFPVEIALD